MPVIEFGYECGFQLKTDFKKHGIFIATYEILTEISAISKQAVSKVNK